MTIMDNGGYVKQAKTGFLGLLMAQGTASAESKFLSLTLTGSPTAHPYIPML